MKFTKAPARQGWWLAAISAAWVGMPIAHAQTGGNAPEALQGAATAELDRSEPGEPLSLEAALGRAFSRHPELASADAAVATARARLEGAGVYPHNPTVLARVGARRGDDGSSATDFRVFLGQRIQLAGQRRDAVAVGRREVGVAEADRRRRQRLLAAQVHLAFVRALAAKELVAIAVADRELAQRLQRAAGKRLARGSATQLDLNVASAELGRAQARYEDAVADYTASQAELAHAIGASPTKALVPSGELDIPLDAVPDLAELTKLAEEHRADLEALRLSEDAARGRLALAKSSAWPDLNVAAFGGREEGTDTILGGSVSVPLPLFNRNQGRIAEARAGRRSAEALREAAELLAAREVVTARARLVADARKASSLRSTVVATLENNLSLLQRALDAGKITWPEVLVIRRTFVDARRELVEASASARRSWVFLQVASGLLPLPTVSHPSE